MAPEEMIDDDRHRVFSMYPLLCIRMYLEKYLLLEALYGSNYSAHQPTAQPLRAPTSSLK